MGATSPDLPPSHAICRPRARARLTDRLRRESARVPLCGRRPRMRLAFQPCAGPSTITALRAALPELRFDVHLGVSNPAGPVEQARRHLARSRPCSPAAALLPTPSPARSISCRPLPRSPLDLARSRPICADARRAARRGADHAAVGGLRRRAAPGGGGGGAVPADRRGGLRGGHVRGAQDAGGGVDAPARCGADRPRRHPRRRVCAAAGRSNAAAHPCI